jgi:hypothetical protein
VKTKELEPIQQQIKEKDIFEQSNIFDAVIWGMKISAYSNKLKEKDNQNDRSK